MSENRDVRPARRFWFVIPVHNRRELTARCLQALGAQKDQQFSIVVVDDGSTDGTSQMIAEQFTDVHVVRGNGDWWWTGSTRHGIDYVLQRCHPEDAVVLLNDDTMVDPDFVGRLRQASEANPDSLIGSVVLDINQRDVITDGGCRINWSSAKWAAVNSGSSLSSFPEAY